MTLDATREVRATPFGLAALAVGVLALLLREWFALVAVPTAPLRGDVLQYVTYAYNLLEHATFSRTPIGAEALVADAFRSPGYPGFLALAMLAGGTEGGWYGIAVQAQVVLGAATCVLACVFARPWLGSAGAIAGGALLAVWPHHVVASAALLSEVVFGFLLLLAAWLTALSLRRRSAAYATAAGAAFAAAWLVNPLVLPFALALGAAVAWRARPRAWTTGLWLLPLLCSVAWSARNAVVAQHDEPGRATLNLVQGAWPDYHSAYRASRGEDPDAVATMRAIGREERLMHADPAAGIAALWQRMRARPAEFAAWYAFGKPWLLWDWDIRIGVGDIYVLDYRDSPFETSPLLRATRDALRGANPALFALALAAALATLVAAWRRRPMPPVEALLVTSLFLFVTLVHTVFQAEPRYAIPYRPLQLLLAVAALAMAWRALRARIAARD